MVCFQGHVIRLLIVAFVANEFIISCHGSEGDNSSDEGDVSDGEGDVANKEANNEVNNEANNEVNKEANNEVNNEANCIPDPDEVERLFKENTDVEENRKAVESDLGSNERSLKQSNQKVADISLIRNKEQDPVNRAKEFKQLIFQTVTQKLVEEYKLTSAEIHECLPNVELDGEYSMQAVEECMQIIFHGRCDSKSRYRTADGHCNNLRNPRWGASGACFQRLLPARYIGESTFRQSYAGGPLPFPRDLSLRIHSNQNRPTTNTSHMYMFFGQLLDHDLTQAPFSVTENNEPIRCCGVPPPLHPQCIPIPIRPNDPFYAQFGTTCINLVRTALCPTCKLGPRQQPNEITAFIDASFMYGNSEGVSANLRTNDGTGRMRFQRTSVGDLLPPSPNPATDRCSIANTTKVCFQAGDGRANQHPPLAALHTIFLRFHNQLADGLKQMNPKWSDERIFQEARKIVGAVMEVITYKEYLPITLGNEQMTDYNLWPTDKGWSTYDPTVDPTLFNEFSVAGFRFGHSLINKVIANNPKNSTGGVRWLRDEFFVSYELRTGILSPLMVGLCQAPAQEFDRHLVPDVTNFLFRIRGQPSGLDLAAINIQRGRDHGAPTYTEMVYYCTKGKITIKTFKELFTKSLMTDANARLLFDNYKHVKDIDLWTGILSEIPLAGAVVGRVGACIIGKQFHDLKFGDRFYFEHGKQSGSLSYQQILEVKKMTLTHLLCLTTDIQRLPKNAMRFYSKSNPLVTCENVEGINLSYWREK